MSDRKELERNEKDMKANQKRNKKSEKKVQIVKGNKSPKKKREIKVQIEIGKSKLERKKKSFLRARCKIAVKNDPKHTSYGIANAIHLSLRPSTSSVVNCATNCFLESLFIIGIRTLFPLILVNSWGLPSSKDFAQEALKNRALTIKNAVSGDTLSEI